MSYQTIWKYYSLPLCLALSMKTWIECKWPRAIGKKPCLPLSVPPYLCLPTPICTPIWKIPTESQAFELPLPRVNQHTYALTSYLHTCLTYSSRSRNSMHFSPGNTSSVHIWKRGVPRVTRTSSKILIPNAVCVVESQNRSAPMACCWLLREEVTCQHRNAHQNQFHM